GLGLLFLLLFIIIIFLSVHGKACTPCPKGWNIFNDKCYYQFRIKKNWEESKTYCSEHGGNLAVIESQEEQEFIKTFIKDGNSWIGLTDRKREGYWLWVNGAELKKRWEGILSVACRMSWFSFGELKSFICKKH
uniref:C-type lectin domain-containing protein n=1 Tax=Paramormyrops kingsleyae TaxID=1676925 RepID=A0A3B3SJF4_9TELE